jgi:hypothetical protein
MSQHKSFEGVAAVGLPVDDVEDFLVKLLTLRKAGRPVVAGATSIFGQENVFLNKKVNIYYPIKQHKLIKHALSQ